MKEVIDKILKEEKAAQERVAKARQDARQMRTDTEKEAERLVEEARKKASENAKTLISRARQDAEKQREKALEAVKAENEALMKNADLDDLAGAILKDLLGGT